MIDNKKLNEWFDRYEEYTGCNGDGLACGMIRAFTDTGILTDGWDQDEVIQYEKQIGRDLGDWTDVDYDRFPGKTHLRMQAELCRIMGVTEVTEELCNEVADELGL